jgi:hypothetical protein
MAFPLPLQRNLGARCAAKDDGLAAVAPRAEAVASMN